MKIYKKILIVTFFSISLFSSVIAGGNINKCPGESLSLKWNMRNAFGCYYNWNNEKVNYGNPVTGGTRSFGDTSLWPIGTYTVTLQCYNYWFIPNSISYSSVNIINSSSCSCGAGSTASICYCPSGQTRILVPNTSPAIYKCKFLPPAVNIYFSDPNAIDPSGGGGDGGGDNGGNGGGDN